MEQEVKSASTPNQEMKQILSQFIAGVVQLEQLAEIGSRFLISFKQALEFVRRPSIHDTSKLVQSILKENETDRVKSYVEAGCTNSYNDARSVSQMNLSLSELYDHLGKAKYILTELETLLEKAGCCFGAKSSGVLDLSGLDFSENPEQESNSENKEFPLHKVVGLDDAGCASFMAVIYSMVKQDYMMQERVISSIGLMSSSGELDSYCMMWSLRPFVNDSIIHEAGLHPSNSINPVYSTSNGVIDVQRNAAMMMHIEYSQ